MGENTILRAEGVRKAYKRRTVLEDAALAVDAGKSVCLFGPNGSGKSTLLDILALASRPEAGSIVLDGADALRDPRTAREKIGYVPQDIALFQELTVLENLQCWAKGSRAESRAAAERVMEELLLTSIRRKRVGELSGGMKRRVNLAAALLGTPRLLVLDEPFAGVDFEHTENMLEVLHRRKESGTALLISDHSAHRLLPLMDGVLVLREGRTLFSGTRDEFLQGGDDADGALRALLGGAQ